MKTNKHELHLLKPWKRWLFFFERRLVVPISSSGRSQQPTYQYRLARRS